MASTLRTRAFAFWLIALAGCGVDLLTKSIVFRRLGMPDFDNPKPPWWIWEPYFGLQTSLNEGALFGIGQGKVWLFASLSVVAIFGVCYWLYFAGAAADRMLTVALAMIMGGILGNLHDRLGLWEPPELVGVRYYAVRDWILFQWNGWVWPNFNIADSLLVCGVALLVWHAYRHGDAKQSSDVERVAPPV
ncbi:MAG TPA: signal peptidase II [Pirellulales bacterium]|jgi:signal peptidase II